MSKASVLAPIVLERSTLPIIIHRLSSLREKEKEQEKEKESDTSDLRKQPVNKLRNIVAEKGLASDPSKLKKADLLKMLGID